jgi:hypothetical protein
LGAVVKKRKALCGQAALAFLLQARQQFCSNQVQPGLLPPTLLPVTRSGGTYSVLAYAGWQEYLGSYVSDASGKLVFREGALVQVSHQLGPPVWGEGEA